MCLRSILTIGFSSGTLSGSLLASVLLVLLLSVLSVLAVLAVQLLELELDFIFGGECWAGKGTEGTYQIKATLLSTHTAWCFRLPLSPHIPPGASDYPCLHTYRLVLQATLVSTHTAWCFRQLAVRAGRSSSTSPNRRKRRG